MATTGVARQSAAEAARQRAKGAAAPLTTLEQQVANEVAGVRKRVVDRSQHVQELKATASELAEAIARKDIDKAAMLTATFNSAADSRAAMEKTQRGAMLRLAQELKSATGEIKQMTELNSGERKLIADAEKAVADGKRQLEGLNAEHTAAYTKTRLFGIRRRAIESTQADVDAKTRQITTLEAAVQTQREIAERMREARVDTITLDEAMTHILTATKDAVNLARDNLAETREELTTITDNRVRTEDLLETLSQDRVAVEGKLKAANAEITQLENELNDLQAVKGSPEWVEKNNAHEQKKADRLVLEGEQAKALELYRTAEAAREAFTAQESSLQVHIQCIELEVAILEANVRDQMAEISSFAVVAKRAQDLKSLHLADDIGRQMREDVAKTTTEFTVAALSKRAERAESMPGHIKALQDIVEVGEQARADSDARIQAQIDLLAEKYQEAFGAPAN